MVSIARLMNAPESVQTVVTFLVGIRQRGEADPGLHWLAKKFARLLLPVPAVSNSWRPELPTTSARRRT
jgi:hypothetical protein